MQSLTKGANATVVANAVRVNLTWDRSALDLEVDASALLCGPDGRVASDDDFVFFNHTSHPSQTVRHLGFDYSDLTISDRLEVALFRVPATVDTIRIAASTNARFGQVPNLVVQVVDADSEAVLFAFPIAGDGETAMVVGELYRRGGAWKFRAVGQGYDDGLAGLARDFGINIDGTASTPAPVSALTPSRVPGPVNRQPTPSNSPPQIDWLHPPVPAGYEI